MNCKDCKHWDERPFHEIAFRDHTPGMRLGECMMAAPSYRPHQAFLAVATCRSEGIYGDLITQDSFGCIQFEPKEMPDKLSAISAGAALIALGKTLQEKGKKLLEDGNKAHP